MKFLLWGLIAYHSVYAAVVAGLLIAVGPPASRELVTWSALISPLMLAAVAWALLMLGGMAADRPRWLVASGQAALVLLFFVVLPSLPVVRFSCVLMLGLAGLDVARLALSAGGAIRARLEMASKVVLVLVALHVFNPWVRSPGNELGLMAGPAGQLDVICYEENQAKDNYPRSFIGYNSLGWRDVEPPLSGRGDLRVLLVGDSYLWGDGVPTNEETLAYRLRGYLEESAPFEAVVMAAGYPGLDLYGYARFIHTVAPLFRPDLVVVSYLGESDLTRLDTQQLLDALPSFGPLRALVIRLRALQHIHESSQRGLVDQRRHLDHHQDTLDSLRTPVGGARYEVALLDYSMPRDWSLDKSELLHWRIPERWAYRQESCDLWYGKDNHPRPELVDMVALWLAERIVTHVSEREGSPVDQASVEGAGGED